MSGFICSHCKKEIDLFGAGGGEKSAHDLNVPFLGRIPLEPEMVKLGDLGQPFVHFRKETATANLMNEIINKVTKYFKLNEA